MGDLGSVNKAIIEPSTSSNRHVGLGGVINE